MVAVTAPVAAVSVASAVEVSAAEASPAVGNIFPKIFPVPQGFCPAGFLFFAIYSAFAILKSMRKILTVIIIPAAIAVLVATFFSRGGADVANIKEEAMANPTATVHTNKGDITLELFMDKAPITAGNFLKLAGEGFYNGTKFHRVIAGFMLQGGDPNSKGDDKSSYGLGGPGYMIQDEFIPGFSNVRGTIAMANTGQPNSGGSQFFVNLVDNTGLDYDKPPMQSSHPVFGKVVSGMEAVDEIAKVKTDAKDVPVEPVIIESISISQ